MDTKFYQPRGGMSPLILSMLLVISSSSLLSCEQPQSMFEQQANAKSANDVTVKDSDEGKAHPNTKAAVLAPVTSTTTDDNASPDDNVSTIMIQANKQQAVARQPNCDPLRTQCQYFALNVLAFSPEQPWLSSIMWQTIARVLAPETPLASQDEMAKKTVSMLFNQIEYGEKGVRSLPMYQRIDTELVLHPSVRKILASGDSRDDNKVTKAALDPDSGVDSISIATGYLVVRSSQHRSDSRQQQLTYVMLDIQKKLQLTIEDILLPKVTTDELLLTFQTAKKEWLVLQGVEQKYHEDWPLPLSRQWYLDERGLHMVYQSGELLTAKSDAVDLIVPYTLLQGLIKSRYIVQSPIGSKL